MIQKYPKIVDFSNDLPGKLARIGLIGSPKGDGEKKEGIKIRPLFGVGWLLGKMNQLAQPAGNEFSKAT